jgi:N-acyl-phosphatidylethanolamine-hydrolysing phospholipase D
LRKNERRRWYGIECRQKVITRPEGSATTTEQHVDLEEAVQIHLDLGAKQSVGVHWGTFALADEPLDQPIHELAAARRAKGVAEESFFLLPVGGTRQLTRR